MCYMLRKDMCLKHKEPEVKATYVGRKTMKDAQVSEGAEREERNTRCCRRGTWYTLRFDEPEIHNRRLVGNF